MKNDPSDYIKELLSMVRSDSILVMAPDGLIRRIYCPFIVISKVDFPEFKMGDRLTVDAVKVTLEIKDVFIIGGKAYFIWFFHIAS